MTASRTTDDPSLEVRRIADLPGLLALESPWRRLSDASPDAHLAMLFPMVVANARWRRPDEPWLCHAAFADDGALRLGLFGRRTRVSIKGISVPALDVGTEHVSGMAMALDARPAEVRCLVDALLADQPDRILVEFGKVGQSELELLRAAAAGLMYTQTTAGVGYYFDTRVPIEDLFRRFGPRLRRNLRRERKRLGQRHTIELETLDSTSVGQNLAYLERYMDLEASGWKGRRGSDIRSTEPAYYRSMVESGAREGIVRWYSLLADGRPIAMYLCFRHQSTIWAPKTAYDERFAAYSPGSELLLRVLEQLCADPEIDRLHMITAQPWVAAWHPEAESYYRFRIYPRSLSGRLLCLAERTRERFRRVPPSGRRDPAVIPAAGRNA